MGLNCKELGRSQLSSGGDPCVLERLLPACPGCQDREITNLLSTNLLSQALGTHVATPFLEVVVSSFSSWSIGHTGHAVWVPTPCA